MAIRSLEQITAVGRSSLRPLEELAKRVSAAADRELGVRDEAVGQLRRPKRVEVAERLLAGRQRIGVPRDEADALVAERDQVLRRDPTCGTLVDADGRHVEVLGAAVHEDEPRAALEELGVVRVPAADVGDLGGDEHHALDAALEEHADVVALAARRAVRVAEDRREPAARSVHLHRLGERCETGFENSGTKSPIALDGSIRPGGT